MICAIRMSGAADTEEDLLDAFKVFDKDNDGYITHDELRLVMKQLGKSILRKSSLKFMGFQ